MDKEALTELKNFVAESQYASTMFSQSLLGPVFRQLLSKREGALDILKTVQDIYSGNRHVASTSEILSGYYHERKPGISPVEMVAKVGTKKRYSDPLAFVIGYSAERAGDDDSPALDVLHRKYNQTALQLFDKGGVPVFGYLLDDPVTGGVEGYVGGLESPSVVVGQLVNWWFLRPTHEEALGLFQTVKGYIDKHSNETVKNNDIRILKRAAWDMIRAKKEAKLWGKDNATKIFDAWKESVPVEAKALGSEDAVTAAMELDADYIDDVSKIRGRTEEDDVKRAIDGFYRDSMIATTPKEAINSAAHLLMRLIELDLDYADKVVAVAFLTKQTEGLSAVRDQLFLKNSQLTEEVVRLEKERLLPDEQKLESPRLGHDAAALIFQHSHPEILTQVFSKETVDHFDSIASNLYIEEDQDEGPLVVSSSATGEITKWLL